MTEREMAMMSNMATTCEEEAQDNPIRAAYLTEVAQVIRMSITMLEGDKQ